MAQPNKLFSLNGCQVILDLQGIPDNIAKEMKSVTNCPWLTLKKKITLLDNIRKNYLTSLANKFKVSDRNHY
jgi:hypothetical protein